MKNPFQSVTGQWYFWDEAETYAAGPYETHYAAANHMLEYIEWLDKGGEYPSLHWHKSIHATNMHGTIQPLASSTYCTNCDKLIGVGEFTLLGREYYADYYICRQCIITSHYMMQGMEFRKCSTTA